MSTRFLKSAVFLFSSFVMLGGFAAYVSSRGIQATPTPQNADPEITTIAPQDPEISHPSRLNLPFKIASHTLAPGQYQEFNHPMLGQGFITGGFNEPHHAHSWKNPLPTIGIDGTFQILDAARRNIGIDYTVNDYQVRAWYGGKVIQQGYEGAYGNRVHIQLEVTYKFEGKAYAIYQAYAHCQSISVEVGQHIHQGEVIAIMGGTGGNYAPHVDLSTYIYHEIQSWIEIHPQNLDRQLLAS